MSMFFVFFLSRFIHTTVFQGKPGLVKRSRMDSQGFCCVTSTGGQRFLWGEVKTNTLPVPAKHEGLTDLSTLVVIYLTRILAKFN